MKTLNLARKYSSALFNAIENNEAQETIYKELKVFTEAFNEQEIKNFFSNPLYTISERVNVTKKLVDQLKVTEALKNFLILLAENNRIQIISNICDSFQDLIDKKNGVTRGEVVSSHMLSPKEREQIEDIVSTKTKKRVILTYKENPNLLGGLIAKVDGYTFDDTLTMHLGRLNEDLRRRVH